MQNLLKPIEYAELAVRSLMNTYEAKNLPPKGVLFYHQGVFLSGVERVYAMTGKDEYINYVRDYCDSVIGENGELRGINYESDPEGIPSLAKCALEMLDHKQATVLFYPLYDKFGDEKYLRPIHTARDSFVYWPVNCYGGYWHKLKEPNQMWLDGAYMCCALSHEYANRFGDPLLRERAINQIILMHKYMYDEKTGLYFHAWDPTFVAHFADKTTGLSPEIWGRAVGWFAVAIADTLEYLPTDHEKISELKVILNNLLLALLKYRRSDNGLWSEITDKPEREDNWVESSSSNLFIYAIAKALRIGAIDPETFAEPLETAYEASIGLLYNNESGNLVIDHVCEGTNVESGTYEYYVARRRIKNDLHGAGAFVLMATEMQKYLDSK